jgi:hypothetical protein
VVPHTGIRALDRGQNRLAKGTLSFSSPSCSSILWIVRASKRLRRARTRTTYISARSIAMPVRVAHSLLPLTPLYFFSSTLFRSFPEIQDRYSRYCLQNVANVMAGRSRSRVRGLQLRKLVESSRPGRLRRREPYW